VTWVNYFPEALANHKSRFPSHYRYAELYLFNNLRIQRGDNPIPQGKTHCLGYWRTRQDPSAVASLYHIGSPAKANVTDYTGCQGIIFVVDSNDRERISEARDELAELLKDNELSGVAVQVYANKQDLPNAMDTAELTEKLGMHCIRTHDWYVQPTCAQTGEGLAEGNIDNYGPLILGLEWMTKSLRKR
jgi:hypothetical protein